MSATGRNIEGHERQTQDFYETPAWAAHAALQWLRTWRPTLDPCAGRGALLEAANRLFGKLEDRGVGWIQRHPDCLKAAEKRGQ